MTIDSWIEQTAQETPEKVAIEFRGQSLTYSDFADLVSVRSVQLQAHGVKCGDRIAWLGYNNPEVFVLLFAAAKIGALLVPINWRLAEGEIRNILIDCTPMLVFHDEHFAETAQKIAPKIVSNILGSKFERQPSKTEVVDLSTPLLIVYTSGSTGKPKGVVLTQQALVTNALMSIDAHKLVKTDVVLNVLPLFHVGGLNILATPAFSIGATVILHETVNPALILEDLQRLQAVIVVPTILEALLALPDWIDADFSGLRVMSIGSTDVPARLIDAVHSRDVPLLQIYGATETAPFAIYQRADTAMETAGSIGAGNAYCKIRLSLEDGTEAAVGHPGEIWVKGPNTLQSYWNNEDLTKDVLVDGWYKTGDVASIDCDGNYWFKDRIKHVIISGGENIYPAEVERILRAHEKVAEVSVVGEASQKWGEVAVSVVVAKSPTSQEEILASLTDKLARYKQPKRVVFVKALPRNAMGKVVVSEVRDLL